MNVPGGRIRVVLTAALFGLAASSALEAQAWHYPAFQPPTTIQREFNFAIADADGAGTSLVLQWRNGVGIRSQVTLDAGLADTEGDETLFLIGGTYAYQMVRASADMPLDFLLTAGANGAIGDNSFFRIPIGLVLGHRFPLEGQLAITPYAHPKLMMEFCENCGGLDDDSEFGFGFDLGANFEFSRQLAMRFAIVLGGTELFDDDNAFGFSLAWTPRRGATR